jgi:hypothetical protein
MGMKHAQLTPKKVRPGQLPPAMSASLFTRAKPLLVTRCEVRKCRLLVSAVTLRSWGRFGVVPPGLVRLAPK